MDQSYFTKPTNKKTCYIYILKWENKFIDNFTLTANYCCEYTPQ